MRVIEPSQFNKRPQSKPKKSRKIPALVAAGLLAIMGFTAYSINGTVSEDSQNNSTQTPATPEDTSNDSTPKDVTAADPVSSEKVLRIFTDNELKVFYDNLLQPNLDRVESPPTITGNTIADTRIRQIAKDRGYRLRSSPSTALGLVDGYKLQTAMIQPWLDLKAAAAEEGFSLAIVSGHRSPSRQRELYLSRLSAVGVSIDEVEAGTADEIVEEVLVTSSIPGYSKHHTGYTIDVHCAGYGFDDFKDSPCNEWLIANNYENAKIHGFIPSYPPSAEKQGPDPEAWEYVWVGTDLLYQ